MFSLFSLNLLSFEKEYCIFDTELLYGALQIYAGVDIVTDISSILFIQLLFTTNSIAIYNQYHILK